MNPKKMVRKEKIIGAVLVVLLFALSYFFIIEPRLSAPGKIDKETIAEKQKLPGLQNQEKQFKQQEAEAPAKQALAKSVADQFPPTADVPELTTLIQNTGAASGISPANISVSVGEKEVFTPTAKEAAGGGAAAPAPAAADPAPAPAASAPTSASGDTIYRMVITIKVENASLDQIGSYIVNLSKASRAVYTLGVSSGAGATTGAAPANNAANAAANAAGVPANSSSMSHELESVTFLLPPLTITPPPPVVSNTSAK